jgi:glycosyltransferase involved in cell wall biosynthesis
VLFSLADELHASSKQFVMEMENYLQAKKLAKFIFRRKINFDRMGVDLNRLFSQDTHLMTDKSNRNRTILFMSRVAIWKGFGKFVQIAKNLGK